MRYKNEDIELLKEEYPGYKIWSNHVVNSLHKRFLEEETLNEFLTFTVSREKTLETFKKKFSGKFKLIEFLNGDENILELTVLIKNNFYLEEFNEFMDTFGWFPSMLGDDRYSEKNLKKLISDYEMNDNSNKEYEVVEITYEAKYDTEVDIKQDYLYHLIPDIRYYSMKHGSADVYGLAPKSRSKQTNHPYRIYLFINKQHAFNLAKGLYRSESSEIKSLMENYCLLEIDYKSLKDRIKVLYDDPNMSGDAVYTTDCIPPKYIRVIEKISIKDLK